MNLEMQPLEVIGLKSDIKRIIQTLRQLGCVHVEDLTEAQEISARPYSPDRETVRQHEEQSLYLARIEGMLDALGCAQVVSPLPHADRGLRDIREGLEELGPQLQSLASRREKLEAERDSFPRYEATLRKLLPLIPESAHDPGNISIGVLASTAHIEVLEAIARNCLDLTGGRAEVVASDIDGTTRAMLMIFPGEFTAEIESLLGSEDVSRLRMPAELGEGPPDVLLATLRRRMSDVQQEIVEIEHELGDLSVRWCGKLIGWRDALRNEIQMNRILSRFGETDMTFVLVGWAPAKEVEKVETALRQQVGERVSVRRLLRTRALMKRAPVVLKNPAVARPFESLVNLLALPQYGHVDPTQLMAFFLPIFFGMILGDVGYGSLLLALCLGLRRRYRPGVFHDVLTILALGAGWSIMFGFLYGELFGTLGEQLGMHALWFDRSSSQHVTGLLIMTLAVGSIHITLGLMLGLWEAYKARDRGHLLERGGMLIGLIALFLMIGVLANWLPNELRTPAVVGVIIGIVLMGASLGWLGILLGPIEFIGLIGNILSYLRIAAIGLASVFLAKVANDVAGKVGNLVVGVIVALLLHALNLVLGAFSPTIHSLRLHYVEFFRKFYEGGGRRYEPFKSSLRPDARP